MRAFLTPVAMNRDVYLLVFTGILSIDIFIMASSKLFSEVVSGNIIRRMLFLVCALLSRVG